MSIKETKFFSPSVIGKGNPEGERKGHGVELANGQEKTKSTIDKGPGALGDGDPFSGGTGDYKGSILASLLPALLEMMEDLQKSANIEGAILGQTVTMQALGAKSQAASLKSAGEAQLFAGLSAGIGGIIGGAAGLGSAGLAMRSARNTSKTDVIDEKIATLDSFSARIESESVVGTVVTEEAPLAPKEEIGKSKADGKALINKINNVDETVKGIDGLQSPGNKISDKALNKAAIKKWHESDAWGDKPHGPSVRKDGTRITRGDEVDARVKVANKKLEELKKARIANQEDAVKSYQTLTNPEDQESVRKAVKERKESLKAERAAAQEENRGKSQNYSNVAQSLPQVMQGIGSAGSGVANQQQADMQSQGVLYETLAKGMEVATSQASTESQNLHRAADETQDVVKSVSASQKGG